MTETIADINGHYDVWVHCFYILQHSTGPLRLTIKNNEKRGFCVEYNLKLRNLIA